MHESSVTKMEVTPLLVSVPQGCQIIGRGTAAMYELIGAGKVKAVKSDGRTLLTYESLVAYVASLPPAKIAPPRRRKFEQIKTSPPPQRKPQRIRQMETSKSPRQRKPQHLREAETTNA